VPELNSASPTTSGYFRRNFAHQKEDEVHQ
jgi:hypothetical protein